jgi:hypothetical protein
MGGQPNDLVNWNADSPFGIFIGGDVILSQAADIERDGQGTTHLAEPNDIHIGGKLKIANNLGLDVNFDGHTVDIDDVNVGGITVFQLSGAADDVQITDSRFARKVEIGMPQGDDRLDLDDGPGDENQFNGGLVANGGQGTDVLDDLATNVYTIPPVFNGFESIL